MTVTSHLLFCKFRFCQSLGRPVRTSTHGHREGVELSHLLWCTRWRHLCNALWPPILPWLHPALGRKKFCLPTLQKIHLDSEVFWSWWRWLPTLCHHTSQRVARDQQPSSRSSKRPGWKHTPWASRFSCFLATRNNSPCPAAGCRTRGCGWYPARALGRTFPKTAEPPEPCALMATPGAGNYIWGWVVSGEECREWYHARTLCLWSRQESLGPETAAPSPAIHCITGPWHPQYHWDPVQWGGLEAVALSHCQGGGWDTCCQLWSPCLPGECSHPQPGPIQWHCEFQHGGGSQHIGDCPPWTSQPLPICVQPCREGAVPGRAGGHKNGCRFLCSWPGQWPLTCDIPVVPKEEYPCVPRCLPFQQEAAPWSALERSQQAFTQEKGNKWLFP